jgi:hypothetical protein
LLAYLFWHRPRAGAKPERYEEAQRRFHERLEVPSACFRLERLPFGKGPGYEDWYLVEDWAGLGDLNAGAIDPRRRDDHDRAAALAAAGWGGIYRHLRGDAAIPTEARWVDKPFGPPIASVLGEVGDEVPVWQRQLVLAQR